jgi:hypothetical protein
MSYILTEQGKEEVDRYINELKAKRKEILDAGLDTADDTHIPTEQDILDDVAWWAFDDEGDYYNSWGVTDHYDADYPLTLTLGVHIQETED